MKADGDLTIEVGGQAISGWEQIEVTLSAEAFPPSFAIQMSSQGSVDTIARAGASCTVKLGDDVVITGYIDRDTTGFGEVTFRRDNENGTTAELTLMPKEAFVPEPISLNPVSLADVPAQAAN